jgi:hypothetical protein
MKSYDLYARDSLFTVRVYFFLASTKAKFVLLVNDSEQ